jgi:hypothetical protein
MVFREKTEDCFPFSDRRPALRLGSIEAGLCNGLRFGVGGRSAQILEVGCNACDEQPVSMRDCLAGLPGSPHGPIPVDMLSQCPKRGTWVEEVREH